MGLIGAISLLLILAYIVVCIVSMFTKKFVAYILVALCLLIYTLAILAFQPSEDKHDEKDHDHSKCI